MTAWGDAGSAGVTSGRAGVGRSVMGRSVPERARELAGGLSVLFERDVELVVRLNDAHHRLRDANERLLRGPASAVHWTIHRAFCEYQLVCEERRQLAVDVGELSQQLSDVLSAAGWSRDQARAADVHMLARVSR
jgi:hypothetical protein